MQVSKRTKLHISNKQTMEMEVVASQESSEETGLDVNEAAGASTAAEEENVNTSAIDMLQEHVYSNEGGSVDLAPELNVDENTILLPVAGENGLNADDPAIAFSASDFLQEEEEVMDPMGANLQDFEDDLVSPTRSNRRSSTRTPSQLPKKRYEYSAKYELEDESHSEKKRKRRGRKPGSKVINGQVFYPPEDQEVSFKKQTPKSAAKSGLRSTPRPSSAHTVDESQCRVCMATTELVNIFKREHTKTFAEKLMAICPEVNIQRKDFLPQFICRVCCSSVNAAFALKAQCEQTDVELRERLEKSISKARRPESTNFVASEAEEEYVEPLDQEFKLSDATPPSADDSDSDYGKPLAKRRTRRRSKRGPPASTSKQIKKERKSASGSPPKKVIKQEPDASTSKSSDHEMEQPAGDFSSGSEENYSPPKKRRGRRPKSEEADGTVTCRVCKETLPSKEELKEHKKTMHSHYECELCGRKFRAQSSWKTHMDKHTQSGELKCDICEKHFPNKSERRKHMIDVHNESPAQFVCEKCKRAFTTEVRLMKHNEWRCPGFDTSQSKKRVDLESLAMGKDLFKCVAPLTTTYWSDSFSD